MPRFFGVYKALSIPRAYTLFMILLLTAEPSRTLAQADFESAASGPWNIATTWTIVSGTDPNGWPDANDNVRVLSSHTVSAGTTADRDCANLVVDAGGVLDIDATRNVRINAVPGSAVINGSVVMSSSGRLMETGTGTRSLTIGVGGQLVISGTAANPAFDSYSFDPASLVRYSGTGNQTVLSGVVFGNLMMGGGGRKTVGPIPTDTTFTCAGTLTVATGVTFDVSTNILRINFNGDVLNNGIIDAAVGTTVLDVRGATWTNNGTFLPSVSPGFGLQPTVTFHGTQIGGTTPAQRFFDLRFNGTSSTTVRIDSARDIEILPSSSFSSATSGTHTLTGNWLNQGTFYCGDATVRLMGTAPQTVASSSFCHLVIDNPAGVTLTGNVTISPGGTLTLLNGALTTGPNTLIVNSTDPNALVLGAHQILGSVTRSIASGSTSAYHLFSANAFVVPGGADNPATVTATAYPDQFPPNLAPGADTSVIAKRYYRLDQTGAGPAFSYTLRLPYLQSEARGNELDYVLWRNGGTGWANMGSVLVDPTNNYVEQSSMNSFSDWAIAEDNAALPIQLAYFSAYHVSIAGNVICEWGTVTETNNYGFFVQRSANTPTAYSDLPNSFVPGHGTTLEPHSYQWTDQGVAPGRYYYRLKQVDLDGTTHYAEGVEVLVSGTTGSGTTELARGFALAQNYPNPFNPSTNIEFTVEQRGHAILTVYNVLGEEVTRLFDGVADAGRTYSMLFNAGSLPNGVYVYKLVSSQSSSQRKMVLVK